MRVGRFHSSWFYLGNDANLTSAPRKIHPNLRPSRTSPVPLQAAGTTPESSTMDRHDSQGLGQGTDLRDNPNDH